MAGIGVTTTSSVTALGSLIDENSRTEALAKREPKTKHTTSAAKLAIESSSLRSGVLFLASTSSSTVNALSPTACERGTNGLYQSAASATASISQSVPRTIRVRNESEIGAISTNQNAGSMMKNESP